MVYLGSNQARVWPACLPGPWATYPVIGSESPPKPPVRDKVPFQLGNQGGFENLVCLLLCSQGICGMGVNFHIFADTGEVIRCLSTGGSPRTTTISPPHPRLSAPQGSQSQGQPIGNWREQGQPLERGLCLLFFIIKCTRAAPFT